MFKKGLFILASFVLAASAFAHGKGDIDKRDVAQMDSWQEDFDIDKKKDGKYNVLVTVEDKGGNEVVGGPYNIFIDKDSDYTISGITNPIKEMRVPGNLNIVGTCIDDDGVDEVWLILDGGDPVKADGKEFWSYYLDTTELSEGPHSIEVYGIDINGLSSANKPKKKDKVVWNLDRRLPVTEVTNHTLGELVSGKITIKGNVSDGNGIKSLQYSLDGRQNFFDLKLKEDKKTGICTFELPVNTKDSPDGAAVCWFKATDKMGSVGYNSYLYFIDNTKPDVKIVSPAPDEVCNGRFGVAGFAKDVIGIQSITWSCNGESGEFELIPGNPYWYKEIDTTGLTKNVDFVVTAVDTVGNSVTVKRTIPLKQEDDKPVVTIEYPAADGTVEGKAGTVFLRGIVADDDGVASVEYSVDGGEAKTMDTKGVFYALISPEADLPSGKHSITVTATDIYGVKGNPVTVSFTSKGNAPVFGDSKIESSLGSETAFTGMTVHPESNPFYVPEIKVDAPLSSLAYKMEWGKQGIKSGEIPLKTPKFAISGDDVAYGAVKVTVTAADIYNRVSEQVVMLNMKDLTDITVATPAVVFDDSRVSDNGDIINDAEHPVTGYFAGGKIKSATLSPATPFAKIEYNENTITLNATDSIGASSPVKVRVVSTDGVVYESRPLIFHSDSPAPTILADQKEIDVPFAADESGAVTVSGGKIKITGKVQSQTPLTSLQYRTATAALPANASAKVAESVRFGSLTDITNKSGNYEFELDPATMGTGVTIVEIVANNGKQAAAAVAVRKIAPAADTGKKAAPKSYYIWADGTDSYCVTVSSAVTSDFFQVYPRVDMPAGKPVLKKMVSGKAVSTFTTSKDGSAKVFLTSVAGNTYASGMHVVVPAGVSKDSVKATAVIVSDSAVTGVSWSLSGEGVPGGESSQSGKVDAKSIRPKDSTHYEVDIPLNNLPNGLVKVSVTAETSQGNATYKGTVAVVRAKDSTLVESARKIHWAPSADAVWDAANGYYSIASGLKFGAFANCYAPLTAAITPAQPGLTVTADGCYVYVIAEKEGLYKNVVVTVKDSQGVTYTSSPVNILVDNTAPAVTINKPEAHKWVKNSTGLSVKATDANGVAKVEYSIDGGESWNLAKPTDGGNYTASLNFEGRDDGLIPLDVRVTDNAGKVTTTQSVVQKDTEIPAVEVIEPCAEDIVNGDNLIAFRVKDKGSLARAEYVAPKRGKEVPAGVPVELGPMIVTHVGTTEKPIDDNMVFNFYDEMGNVAVIRKWDFIIDNKSDLPVAEVHLPEENAVITTDFTISGVVIDDDGPSKIYYKIDNGEYKLSAEDYGTSFSIDVPLSSMKDNEHTVTVYAVDLNGVKGPEFVRNFRVSLEEPKGAVETPPISETVRGWVKLTGHATDKNGISKVYISVDNGNSYDEAKGVFKHEKERSEWTYEFDTRVVQDGTHVVFLKIVDWFGIEGLYSSLINIDNTAPSINLELPLDDSKTTKMLFFSGQTTDNIGLEKLYITIRSLEGKVVSQKLARKDLVPGEIITESIDMSELDNGFYNVELTGHDAADNITRVSRNVQLNKNSPVAKVDLLYPLNGEFVQGVFNIYGTAVSEINIDNLELLVDGEVVATTTLSPSGYYKFNINPAAKENPVTLTDGQHKIKVRANLANVSTIMSNEQYLNYNSVGPWVTVDNFTYGDFAIERPFVGGSAGYSVSEEEVAAVKAKGASKEMKNALAAKSVEKIEISFNNGKSFQTVSETNKWKFRIENEDIAEGYHFMLVRATMKNGEKAVTRTIVQVDKTKPTVKLISPGEGGRFNQNLEFSGLAHDNVALKNVTLMLRKGDKASYEVPAFIQGLYLDFHFWGATLYDIGLGLSFFDDNVRLQGQWGQFTQEQRNLFSNTNMRYGGDNVIGGKILANVAYIPFMYFFGRDYEWLSANVTVGANFTRFNETGSGKPQILSALLAQLEFPRISFAKQKMFRTVAVYTEGQLWFIPTDVSSDVDIENLVPQVSLGLRINVF